MRSRTRDYFLSICLMVFGSGVAIYGALRMVDSYQYLTPIEWPKADLLISIAGTLITVGVIMMMSGMVLAHLVGMIEKIRTGAKS